MYMNMNAPKDRDPHAPREDWEIAWDETIARTTTCVLCGTPIVKNGTGRCDACWELEKRIGANPAMARKILERLNLFHDMKESAQAKQAIKIEEKIDSYASGFRDGKMSAMNEVWKMLVELKTEMMQAMDAVIAQGRQG